jgi:phosphomannomutase
LKKFIFDVDGTLTDSRQQIDLSFEVDMIKFCCKNDVYLVTGSDREKTIDQLGLDICYRAKRVYNCSGSDVYVKDKNIYTSEWKPYGNLINFLSDELDYSTFPYKTGNHIEHRPGGINFSILGRGNDSMKHRDEYVKWDVNTGERVLIADRTKNEFPDLNIQIGGQTGIDISDSDKSQILRDFNPEDEIHFYGDMMEEGQNDYPLAKALKEMGGYPHHVKNWEDTRTLLSKV